MKNSLRTYLVGHTQYNLNNNNNNNKKSLVKRDAENTVYLKQKVLLKQCN